MTRNVPNPGIGLSFSRQNAMTNLIQKRTFSCGATTSLLHNKFELRSRNNNINKRTYFSLNSTTKTKIVYILKEIFLRSRSLFIIFSALFLVLGIFIILALILGPFIGNGGGGGGYGGDGGDGWGGVALLRKQGDVVILCDGKRINWPEEFKLFCFLPIFTYTLPSKQLFYYTTIPYFNPKINRLDYKFPSSRSEKRHFSCGATTSFLLNKNSNENNPITKNKNVNYQNMLLLLLLRKYKIIKNYILRPPFF